MGADGASRDGQPGRDLGVGAAFGHMVRDEAFGVGECFPAVAGAGAGLCEPRRTATARSREVAWAASQRASSWVKMSSA